MSRFVIAPIAAGVMLALAGAAQAASKTDGFTVSATVANNCLITAQDMNFGSFELTDTSVHATTSDILVRCTNGTSYGIALSVGSGSYASRTLTNGPDALIYNLYTDGSFASIWGDAVGGGIIVNGAGTGMGIGELKTHKVHGRILGSDNVAAKPTTIATRMCPNSTQDRLQ